jgi:hypothetical protein
MSTTPQVVDTSKRVILDYTSRDYKAIRSMLVGLAGGLLPDWETVGETGDFGTLLLELYAYTGDVMNYYVDRVASEAFLGTAVRRQSALYIADMLGYQPMGQRAASVPITFTWTWDTNNLTGGVIPISTYAVASATATNGVATVGVTSDTFSVVLVPGQTVTISGVGSPFDGRFVVRSVTDATATTPLLITYNITDPAVFTGTIGGSSQITTGSVVIVLAGTRLSSAPDASGQVYTFETDIDVTLDTAAGKSTPAAPTVFTVTFATTASEGLTVAPYLLGTSQGIPNAEYVISDVGVIDRTVQVFTKEGGAVITWASLQKIAQASPTQSSYATYIDDQNFTHIMFGDGTSGRIPPANAEIYVGYRFGSGAAANNLGIGSINVLNNDFATSLGVSVSNPGAPVGGADVESVDSMRFSIPRSNALKQRAVTLDDYTSLALQVPGITKATAYGQNYTSVYVRIASSPQSQGYVVTDVTGLYVSTATIPAQVTVPLNNDYALVLGEFFFLDNVRDDLDGTQTPTNVWLSSSTQTVVTAASLTSYVVTLTTATVHTYQQGQPIVVSGVNQAVFNGVQVISAVPDANTVQYLVATAGPTTGIISGTAAITAEPGITFESDTTTDTTPGGGAGPVVETVSDTATTTSIDPEMQKLINALESYLVDKKLIGSVVYGEPVQWTDTDINMNVVVRPLYNRESVRSAVQSAVMSVFDYTNVDFGRRVSIGDVYRAALAVDGVDYVVMNRLAETVSSSYNVVKDINGTDDYVLTVTRAQMDAGVVTLNVHETLNLKVGDTVTVTNVGSYFDGQFVVTTIVSEMRFTYATLTGLTFASFPTTNATATRDDSQNLYRIPRINPNLALPWVTATGGLVNT